MADRKQSIDQELEEIKVKISNALDLATSFGVSSAEIAISRQRGLSVSARNGEVENVEFNQDGALGISVYRDGRKGSASTSDLSEDALARTVKAACDIAHHTSQDSCAGLAEKDMLEMNPKDLDLYHSHHLTPEEGIEMAIEAETAGFDHSDLITNSDGAGFSGHEGFRAYGNTHGQLVGYPTTRYSLSCSLIAQSGDDMQRDSHYTISRDFSRLDPSAQVGVQAGLATVSKLNSKKIDTIKAPVIFRADVAGGLFGHLVSAIGGGNLYRKSSFLMDKINTQVMSPNVTILENPHLHRGLASCPFDSEGSKTFEMEVVSEGELKTYLLASYAARKLNMKSTGHAGGIHNWLVQSTLGDLDEMAKTMGKGLIVTEVMGHGVNVVTGDYSRGAAGFWVDNGVVQYPVSEVTIAGNLKDIFMNIAGIGSDVDRRGNIQSGSVLVEEMLIAGN